MDSSYEDYNTWTYEDEDMKGPTIRVAPRTFRLVVNDYVPKICDMEYQVADESMFADEPEEDFMMTFAQTRTTESRQQGIELIKEDQVLWSNYKQPAVQQVYQEVFVSEEKALATAFESREQVHFDAVIPQREIGMSSVQGNAVSIMHGPDMSSQLYEEVPFLQIPEDVVVAVSEHYGVAEMARAMPMSYDQGTTFESQEDFEKYKSWIKHIENHYHPIKYDNKGCFVMPVSCSLEKKTYDRPLVRQDIGRSLLQIINNPKQESQMKRVSAMGYMELVGALANRYGIRRIVNVRLIRRLMRKLYYKMDNSALPCVRNRMRYVITHIWQVIMELLVYGADVCWQRNPYDVLSQKVIRELYMHGLLPMLFKGAKVYSMRGDFMVNRYHYHMYVSIGDFQNFSYVYPGMGEIMECLFFICRIYAGEMFALCVDSGVLW